MNEKQAEMLARVVGGEAWDSGGDTWLVTVNRPDGSLVCFSGDAICEYESEEAFDESRASNTILMVTDETEAWVLTDPQGTVFYQDNELEVPWRDEETARREGLAWWSRDGVKYTPQRIEDVL